MRVGPCLGLQHKYMPKARVQGEKRRKEIWLMHKADKMIRRKYKVYRKYRDSKHPACIRADKKVHKEIRLSIILRENWQITLRRTLSHSTLM